MSECQNDYSIITSFDVCTKYLSEIVTFSSNFRSHFRKNYYSTHGKMEKNIANNRFRAVV